MNVIIDELHALPLRRVIGDLMAASRRADFAVSLVRLGAIDVSPDETAGLQQCRFLLARLDATDLGRLAGGMTNPAALHNLHRLLSSGRVEVRSAGTTAWHPDFSIYSGIRNRPVGADRACLVGAHYFYQPVLGNGPSLTCLLTSPAAVAVAQKRFDALWEQAHDVGTVLHDTLAHAVESHAGST